MRVEGGDLRVATERRLAGEAFENQAAQRIDVGPTIGRGAADLLGGDIVDRPLERSGHDIGHGSRETEIGEVAMLALSTRGDEHVARLHVPMDEPVLMGDVECVRKLGRDRESPPRLERRLFPKHALQVCPLDVPHGDVELPVYFAGVVDRNDCRMVDRGRELGLPKKALAEVGVAGELGREELQRHPPLEPEILREVDDAHPSSAEERLDPITGEHAADAGIND